MGMCKIGGSSMASYGNYQAIALSDDLCWYAGSIERLQDNKQLCPSGSSQIVTASVGVVTMTVIPACDP